MKEWISFRSEIRILHSRQSSITFDQKHIDNNHYFLIDVFWYNDHAWHHETVQNIVIAG